MDSASTQSSNAMPDHDTSPVTVEDVLARGQQDRDISMPARATHFTLPRRNLDGASPLLALAEELQEKIYEHVAQANRSQICLHSHGEHISQTALLTACQTTYRIAKPLYEEATLRAWNAKSFYIDIGDEQKWDKHHKKRGETYHCCLADAAVKAECTAKGKRTGYSHATTLSLRFLDLTGYPPGPALNPPTLHVRGYESPLGHTDFETSFTNIIRSSDPAIVSINRDLRRLTGIFVQLGKDTRRLVTELESRHRESKYKYVAINRVLGMIDRAGHLDFRQQLPDTRDMWKRARCISREHEKGISQILCSTVDLRRKWWST